MTRVYIPDTTGVPEGLLVSLVFWSNYRFEISPKRLFLRDILESYTKPFFTFVNSIEEADFVAVPFEYFFVLRHAPEYLSFAYALAKKANKKVLLFDYTDYVDRVPALPPHAVLFRVSTYRHHKQKNEIVMPYVVEDFGKTISPHTKKPERPVVGFCGLSRFDSRLKILKMCLKELVRWLLFTLTGDAISSAHAGGIFWRRRAIAFLRKANAVDCLFIERDSYSLHRHSISGDPEQVRGEYRKNLAASHLALVVRGDSNASQRFYETLSACRVPLFLDTDCVLPLEELIDYDAVMIRVPWRRLSALAETAAKWYASKTQSEFAKAQNRAREIFQTYLRLDRYFEIVFDKGNSPYAPILFTERD